MLQIVIAMEGKSGRGNNRNKDLPSARFRADSFAIVHIPILETFSIQPKPEIAFPNQDITTIMESHVESRYRKMGSPLCRSSDTFW
jgi:hypothetical protein